MCIRDSGKTEKIDSTFTINKTGDGESLTAPLTRAQAVQRLYDAAGRPAVSTAAGFADVSADASYLKAVAWAKAQGIVKGVTCLLYTSSPRPPRLATRSRAVPTVRCASFTI